MDYFAKWSFDKWQDLLGGKLREIEKPSFLLASLLPISEIFPTDSGYDILVRREEIELYTDRALDGMKILVENGYAKWVMDNTDKRRVWAIKLGVSENMLDLKLYPEMKKEKRPFHVKKSVVGLSQSEKDGLAVDLPTIAPETIKKLDKLMARYEKYCDSLGIKDTPDKVYDSVKSYIKHAKHGGVNSGVLLTYLDGVNAMVNEELKMTKTNHPKFHKAANQVLMKVTPQELFSIVPDFVLNYPTMAKSAFRETTIFNLSFHLNTFKARTNKKKTVERKYDEDDTL